MATHEIPILGAMTAPDSSGDIFFEPLETAMTLGTATFGSLLGLTMLAPTGSDIGIYGKFNIPQNYVGTPVLVIRGAIAQAASVLAFGLQQIGRDDSEAIDTAFEAEDTASNSDWTGYAAEDIYEETITITPAAAYVAGDEVFFFFYRDDSADTQTGEFHLTGLFLRYNDA
ncbi:MAG: hypothetical protein V3W09_04360 [Nitrososphaerales archaeon]